MEEMEVMYIIIYVEIEAMQWSFIHRLPYELMARGNVSACQSEYMS